MSAIIESASDVLHVLRDLMEHPAPLESYTIADFAAKYDFDYQKARRIVFTLVHHGFLQQQDEGYQLSIDIIMLAKHYFKALASLQEIIIQKAKQFNDLEE